MELPKLSVQAIVRLLDSKGVDPNLEKDDLVDGPTVLCPAKPWTGDEGALTARLLFAVPAAETGLLAEARTDMPLKAALLGVVPGAQLEVKGLCLGVPLGMGLKMWAAVPQNLGCCLVLGLVVSMGVLW